MLNSQSQHPMITITFPVCVCRIAKVPSIFAIKLRHEAVVWVPN